MVVVVKMALVAINGEVLVDESEVGLLAGEGGKVVNLNIIGRSGGSGVDVLALLPPGDLGNVGTGQGHGHQLNNGQECTLTGVHDHKRDNLVLELDLEDGQTAVPVDAKRMGGQLLPEYSSATALLVLVAAGVRDVIYGQALG